MPLFGSLTRRPAPRTRASNTLRLERLDERIVPAAPTVTGLSLNVVGQYLVVSGHIVDDSPGADTVTSSGSVSGSVPTSTGDFHLYAPYTGTGNVTVHATNNMGIDSAYFNVTLGSPPNQIPGLSYQVMYGPRKTVTFSGVVSDENPAGLVVSFTGAASASATTDASGHFNVTVTANGLGDVSATVADRQGLLSTATFVTLVSAKPVIDSFTICQIAPNVFQLQGHVSDPFAAGLTVHLTSEISAINGQSVTVDADGCFHLNVTLTDPQDVGPVSVDFTNWWGVAADTDTTMLTR